MRDLIKYQCECCGGVIDPKTLKCEYCGMTYKIKDDTRLIRIETLPPETVRLRAKTSMSKRFISEVGIEEASKIATRELTHELSKSLATVMRVKTCDDYPTCTVGFEADICLVLPRERGL